MNRRLVRIEVLTNYSNLSVAFLLVQLQSLVDWPLLIEHLPRGKLCSTVYTNTWWHILTIQSNRL